MFFSFRFQILIKMNNNYFLFFLKIRLIFRIFPNIDNVSSDFLENSILKLEIRFCYIFFRKNEYNLIFFQNIMKIHNKIFGLLEKKRKTLTL